MSTPRSIGIGLIAVGWMGRAHTRAYKALREQYNDLPAQPRLVVAADVTERGRHDAVEMLGYERATADYHEVLNDPEVEAVSICAPNFLHREIAVAAAAAGKPFWIEKPMGCSLADSDEIAKAAADAGIVTAVGFNYRNPPAIQRAREIIQSGELGTVTNVRVAFMADYSADPAGALTWRFEKERAGSGVLGDLLSHGFDLATHLVAPITEVTALTSIVIKERNRATGAGIGHNVVAGSDVGEVENEDYAAVLARFEGGAAGVFESSRVAIGPRAEYILEVYGTNGSLRWDFQRFNELQLVTRNDGPYGYTTILAGPTDGDFARFQPSAGTSMGFDDLKTIEAAAFIRSIAEGTQYGASVVDGRAAAAIADAAERSALSGQWERPA